MSINKRFATVEIEEVVKPKQAVPKKEILWAAQDGDNNRFPAWIDIEARCYAEQPNPLAAFGKAVSQAQERVLVIDPYFLKPDDEKKVNQSREKRIYQILQWIPETIQANDIRFLTTSHNTAVDNNSAKRFEEHAETKLLTNLE